MRTSIYREGHNSMRLHTQRSAGLNLKDGLKANDSLDAYAIYYDAVYNLIQII